MLLLEDKKERISLPYNVSFYNDQSNSSDQRRIQKKFNEDIKILQKKVVKIKNEKLREEILVAYLTVLLAYYIEKRVSSVVESNLEKSFLKIFNK